MKCYVICDKCGLLSLETKSSYYFTEDGLSEIICFDCQPKVHS
jgi:hypothetical protein